MTAEAQVNAPVDGFQLSPAVSLVGGNGVIVWLGQEEILARRFTEAGTPIGSQFQVNVQAIGAGGRPGLATDSAGNFVVAWPAYDTSIRARRYDSSGTPLGGEILVNAPTTGTQYQPRVASDSDGAFVVAWSRHLDHTIEWDVFAQRFDSSGSPLGGEFQVNTNTIGGQLYPAVASDASGNFVVAWRSDGQDGSTSGVFGQRYDSSGNPLGGEFQVNTYTTSDGTGVERLDVAFGAGGQFFVTWDNERGNQNFDIIGRRYDAAGAPLGGEFQINTYTTGYQLHPAVAAGPEGHYIVSWESYGQDGDLSGIFAQRFTAAGSRVGAEFQVNTYTTESQNAPAIAIGAAGRFLAAWWARDPNNGNQSDVFARAGGFPDPQGTNVDERPSGGASNVNGVLESGETVTLDPTWRNQGAFGIGVLSLALNFGGPDGPSYSLADSTADYGSIPAGASGDCFTATGNCFEVTVTGARPTSHWDATLDEFLSTLGVSKTWTLHLGESFADVTTSNQFYEFVENIFHNGVTAGGSCGGGLYCPGDSTLRKQMAAFVLRAKEGPFYVPPPATGIFNDVPAADPFAPWIEELYRREVIAGCAAPDGPNYCPNLPVLRQQMPVFLLKTLLGASYLPPACVGVFLDVPCSNAFAAWIEDLFNRQIAAGCGGGDYCPAAPTNRGQMAPFLVKTFDLRLYGP